MPDLTYAIGDVHGRSDLLVDLLDAIEADARGQAYRLVFLGDYIDRGPASAGVIEILRGLSRARAGEITCLLGNHEAMLLESLQDPAATRLWLLNGGSSTLESFGVERPEDLPGDLTEWLSTLPIRSEDDQRHYVHAGFRPGRPLMRQSPEDFLWIREPFLSCDYDFGKHVVHGHTALVTGLPEVRRYRTNLDTAAIYGGPLTAGRFGSDGPYASAFLQVANGGRVSHVGPSAP
jgi:serine/threonine protein phosphatase 1